MARYCRNCGTELPEGAAFCPECGEKAPVQKPKKRYCRNCGAALPAGAAFCPECGEIVPIEIDAPKGAAVTISDEPPTAKKPAAKPAAPKAEQPKAQPARKTTAAAQKTPEKPAAAKTAQKQGTTGAARTERAPAQAAQTVATAAQTPKKKRGLSLLLVLVMLFELGIAAFKYPGFLVPEPDDPGYYKPPTGQNGNSGSGGSNGNSGNTGSTGSNSNSQNTINNYSGPALTEDLKITFSDQEVSAAPAVSAPVSKENPVAECGELTVNLRSWNLPKEGDTLTVRSLGTRSDTAAGWELECWDLSLASGTHEFLTDIEVTVPRGEGDDETTGFVCYNEETGVWEDLYRELSEDGQSYHVYMRHFSPLAKKMLLGWKADSEQKPKMTKTELLNIYGVDAEMFTEISLSNESTRAFQSKRTGSADRMSRGVLLNSDAYWALSESGKYQGAQSAVEDYAKGNASLEEVFKQVSSMENKGVMDYVTTTAGLSMSIGDVLMLGPKAGSAWAKRLGCVGAVLGFLDVVSAYTRITTDYTLRNKALSQLLLDEHKMDLVSGVTGACSVITGALAAYGWDIPTPITWGLAATSLSIFAYGQAMDTLHPYSNEGVTGALYEYFNRNEWGFQGGDFGLGSVGMRALGTMNSKKYAEFKAWLNEHPLDWGMKDNETKDVTDSWVAMVAKLMKMSAEDPDRLPAHDLPLIFDEIAESRAEIFFRLDSVAQQNVYDEFRENKKGKLDYQLYDVVYRGCSEDEAEKLYDYEVARIKIVLAKAMAEVMESVEREAREETEAYINKYLIPMLNSVLVFHVDDASVDGDFTKSVYYHDIYDYPYNIANYQLSAEEAENTSVNYADSDLMVPIAFYDVSAPLFVPLDMNGNWVSRNEYYPNADNFLPRAKGYSGDESLEGFSYRDVVFKCNMYHYIMMGCPTAMVFRVYPEEALKKPEKDEEPKTFKPESEIMVTFDLDDESYLRNVFTITHIYARVTGELTIDAFLGKWFFSGGGIDHYLELSYSSDGLYMRETAYEKATGESDSAGGYMDTVKLNPKEKTLTIGSDDFEEDQVVFHYHDPDHLSFSGITLTRVKDEDE